MKLTIIKIVAAVVAFTLVFLSLQRLLTPKYASVALEGGLIREYYNSGMDQDVIFFGDCEVYANFSTIGLWEEYGITSFIRGSPQQLLWHSHYLFEDTLHFANKNPQVVVLNVMTLQYNEPQYEPYNRLTLDGMRMSPVKIRAIDASRLDGEDWLSYFLPFFRFKDNWRDISEEDFRYFFRDPKASFNGFMVRSEVVPVGFLPSPLVIGNYQFGENAINYLERFAALAKENEIELVLIKAPNLYPFWYDEWDEQVAAFADENELVYINFLNYSDDIGLDFAKHTFNAGLHLNVYGAELMSGYFGRILQNEFGIQDRRGEHDTAAVWDAIAERYHGLIEIQQREIATDGSISSFLASSYISPQVR